MRQVTLNEGFSYELGGPQPSVFLQWKGTNACFDFYCICGAHDHLDVDFAYYVQCMSCDRLWQMPFNLFPRQVPDDEREATLKRSAVVEAFGDRETP